VVWSLQGRRSPGFHCAGLLDGRHCCELVLEVLAQEVLAGEVLAEEVVRTVSHSDT
jgi:hypothetical protein